jgi:hypothetical protein
LNFLQAYTAWLFFYFINNFEYEAVNNWNPFGSWTPSESNPRCGYQHILLDSHYGIGFNIFTLGMPLRFRESFPIESRNAYELVQQEFNFGVNYDPRRRQLPQLNIEMREVPRVPGIQMAQQEVPVGDND